MANEEPKTDSQDEYVKGGKGRRDDVRGSRIFPASAPDAPADAEVRTEGELVTHKGPRPKTDQTSGSK
jgi:hypothetical protein